MPRSESPQVIDLNSVLDMLGCGFGIWDQEGIFLYTNRCLAGWFDSSPGKTIGRKLTEFIPADQHEQSRKAIAEILGGNRSTRMATMRRGDGTIFPVLISPTVIHDEEKAPTSVAAVILDFEKIRDGEIANSESFFSIQLTLSRMANELRSLNLSAALPRSQPLPAGHPDLEKLTPREHEVLTHLAGGMRVANISGLLGVAPSTIRNHLKSIYRKWHVKSQHELIERVRALQG